jgi:hypothetical protein
MIKEQPRKLIKLNKSLNIEIRMWGLHEKCQESAVECRVEMSEVSVIAE